MSGYQRGVLGCSIAGHRYRFWSEGATMRWSCERCDEGGEKTYASAADAARYAAAFDREDSDDVGRRAPFLGMFPLRIAHMMRTRSERQRGDRNA